MGYYLAEIRSKQIQTRQTEGYEQAGGTQDRQQVRLGARLDLECLIELK
jgi:hypothetical protein